MHQQQKKIIIITIPKQWIHYTWINTSSRRLGLKFDRITTTVLSLNLFFSNERIFSSVDDKPIGIWWWKKAQFSETAYELQRKYAFFCRYKEKGNRPLKSKGEKITRISRNCDCKKYWCVSFFDAITNKWLPDWMSKHPAK